MSKETKENPLRRNEQVVLKAGEPAAWLEWWGDRWDQFQELYRGEILEDYAGSPDGRVSVRQTKPSPVFSGKKRKRVSELLLQDAADQFETEKLRKHLSYKFDAIDVTLARDPSRMPRKVDAIYMPGLSEGMVEAYKLFDEIAQLVKKKKVSSVLYSGSNGRGAGSDNNYPGAAWRGGSWIVEELVRRGVPQEMLISTGQDGIHTRAETDELAATAKERGIKSVVMATVPYHRVRSLSCLIGSMVKEKYGFAAYYLDTKPESLDFEIVGSQGRGVRTLEEEIENEKQRAIGYWERGLETKEVWFEAFGAPPKYVDEYLLLRETRLR